MDNKIQNIPRINQLNYKKVPKEFRQVAEGMETQFVNHLMGEMRKTVHKTKQDSAASNYYQSLLDFERSKLMAGQEKGIGLKEMILEQILPQHLKEQAMQDTKAALAKYEKQNTNENLRANTAPQGESDE